MIEAIATDRAPAAIGPYSQAVRHGNLLFVSGQLGLDPRSGQFSSENTSDQMRQCLLNLAAIAEAAGASLSKTVKTTILLTDLSEFTAINEIYGASFTAPFPARATFEVSALPKGAKVEVEAIIALD
ncbi:reactive intermediate/imine deaminase [Rhizobium anhuiense]|uniref:Reactive intermediate/imine deaminase n=1 Tax=Rhizobium anhuiense TaxID=1184720 RepID=A0ABX4J392_9HYPH|nr:Rid family detoxifying hydrolase [Rhizobium anhuiense]PDS41207.1 reactive intermediate/imine deaminase [Rhizobium anhuiense]PDS49665.1 reactive intermediate/imine deaminase [Rhizobium anhuiense]